MDDPDFIDFMMEGGYPLLFPEDFGEYQCPKCGHVTKSGDKVAWVDAEKKTFKCPECGEVIKIL